MAQPLRKPQEQNDPRARQRLRFMSRLRLILLVVVSLAILLRIGLDAGQEYGWW
ncbi:hypothetical protein L2U69_17710 [Zavarzinia compransoris]|uniref:hypothetical protein n=1 Tax=Zavarzinia marina TaxID=2911065 RepID=UPI001F17B9CC|nr:hypothetical protein [Zavarzinia marina]MCF4167488.1 hypothetical protein [Zavarzinia marina]